ncbi:MAG: PEGA domain-containing protein [Proteobacteria bacterium]|nr:PEGA domain-containing protein [Pseudomonadota bacterium]
MRKVFILLLLSVATACSSTTVIRSSDPDARIYVNGEYLGTGRGVYSDQKVAFSRNDVEIRKEGCLPEHYSFRRNEEADVGAIIGGIFFTFPFLWITEYKPHHAYEFQCVETGN